MTTAANNDSFTGRQFFDFGCRLRRAYSLLIPTGFPEGLGLQDLSEEREIRMGFGQFGSDGRGLGRSQMHGNNPVGLDEAGEDLQAGRISEEHMIQESDVDPGLLQSEDLEELPIGPGDGISQVE